MGGAERGGEHPRGLCRFRTLPGARFRNRPNVLWLAGGDFAPPPGSEGEARHLALFAGIRAAGANQLWTGHWNVQHRGGISTDVPLFAPLMEANGVYQYVQPYRFASRAYDVRPPRPVFLLESTYEHEHPRDDTKPFRKAWWWSMLSGGAGTVWSNHFLWMCESTRGTYQASYGDTDRAVSSWRAELDSAGTHQMQHLHRFFEALPWYRLVPAGTHRRATRSGHCGAARARGIHRRCLHARGRSAGGLRASHGRGPPAIRARPLGPRGTGTRAVVRSGRRDLRGCPPAVTEHLGMWSSRCQAGMPPGSTTGSSSSRHCDDRPGSGDDSASAGPVHHRPRWSGIVWNGTYHRCPASGGSGVSRGNTSSATAVTRAASARASASSCCFRAERFPRTRKRRASGSPRPDATGSAG